MVKVRSRHSGSPLCFFLLTHLSGSHTSIRNTDSWALIIKQRVHSLGRWRGLSPSFVGHIFWKTGPWLIMKPSPELKFSQVEQCIPIPSGSIKCLVWQRDTNLSALTQSKWLKLSRPSFFFNETKRLNDLSLRFLPIWTFHDPVTVKQAPRHSYHKSNLFIPLQSPQVLMSFLSVQITHLKNLDWNEDFSQK